jgi:hypothetical protein
MNLGEKTEKIISLGVLAAAKQRLKLPTVVCLCGSTRFMDAFRQANLRETLAGRIVLSVGCDTKSDEMLSITAEQKVALDALHKRKIDLADEILVVSDETGYFGASTRSEIEYAKMTGKEVRWEEPGAEERWNSMTEV